jgi:DNA polymerase I-like protein with 3'-5' exonuclease and polymerase domains
VAQARITGAPSLENVAIIDHNVIGFTRACQNNGLSVDREHFWELSEYLETEIKELAYKITAYVLQSSLDAFDTESADIDLDDFNPDSPDQIATLLFRHLRVGSGIELATTASGNRISTGKKQLERLKQEHPVIPLILQRRELTKLLTTYCRTLPAAAIFVPSIDRWKIYYNIGLTFTSTGRMTCSRLHQIPIRTELGRLIRNGFIPEPGCKFISADFSQLELRILAHCAQERAMIEVFNDPKGDIHKKTQDSMKMPDTMDSLQKRLASKRVNFGICLAAGQRVLTDHGLVPIENLTTNMLLWDGVEWVSHGGVVCNGYREVITYDGITATPDHKVWTTEGRVLSLATAMAEGRRIAVTAAEDSPVRYYADQGEDLPHRTVAKDQDILRELQANQRYFHRRSIGGQAERLLVSARVQVSRSSAGKVSAATLLYNPAAMQKPELLSLRELWGTRDRKQVRECGRLRAVCPPRASASDLQGLRDRQERQRWPLRERESEAIYSWRERAEQKKHALVDVSWGEDCGYRSACSPQSGLSGLPPGRQTHLQAGGLPESAVAGDLEAQTSRSIQKALVYDILNAGPRHRFTCEGKLVSNCYGTTDLGLWLTLQSDGVPCTREQCAEFQRGFFSTYSDVLPYIQKQHYRARRYGFDWNIFGRVSPAPEFRSVHRRIVREGERRSQNWAIQSTAADVFKIAAADVHEFCLEVEKGLFGRPYCCRPLLPVHDQVLIGVDSLISKECSEAIAEIMSNAVGLRVPLQVDSEIQGCWTH